MFSVNTAKAVNKLNFIARKWGLTSHVYVIYRCR